MGLDTTHDAWSGAYSAFSRFRNALAKAAGYETIEIKHRETVLIDWAHFTEENYFGLWGDVVPCSGVGPDPLLYLIVHSDCDGHLEPEHCAALADRLAELLPALAGLDGGGHLGNVHAAARRFIDGCRAAADAGERLEFQ